MAFWDQLQDGATDIASGIGGFAVDSLKAGREFGNFNFGDALSIVVGSFQEDILGQAITGAIGPEGVGGTLIGALPESVRKPIGSVTNPILGYLDWTMQELVDRPLGTAVTVVSATNPFTGKGSMLDLSTWSRAWNINDKRTFGQSFAAALYNIDPFSEEEYNSIQDDPLFDLISGTADFVQELVDPTLLAAGGALKVGRGAAVFATETGTIGRSFKNTGSNRIGRYLAPRQTELAPSHVIGGGVGLRPATIAGKSIKFLTKNNEQRLKLNEIQRNVAAQRARNAAQSPYMREVLGDSVDAAERAKAAERAEYLDKKAEADEFDYAVSLDEPVELTTANERFGIIKTALGPMARLLPDESIRLIANGTTTQQRLNTFRLLAGDFTVLDDAAAAAQIAVDDLIKIDPAYAKESGTILDYELSGAARDAVDEFDFALFAAFEENLILAQRRQMKPDMETGLYEANPLAYQTIGEMPVDLALAAFEDVLKQADDLLVGNAAANLAGAGDGVINLLGTGVFPGQIKNLPFGRRFQELARQHRKKARESGAAYSEYINPNTAFGSVRSIRFITERLPHTHIFFTEANAVDQFERVLTQASRIDNGGMLQRAGISVNEILGEFTAAKIQSNYRQMEDIYNRAIQRINNQIDKDFVDNADFGSLAGIDTSHRSVNQMWEEASEKWVEEQEYIIAVSNPKGELETATQPGKTRQGQPDDPDFDEPSVVRVIRDENAETIIQQLAISPSQIQQSAVLPRYDIVYKEIENFLDAKTQKRVEKAKAKAKKKGRDVEEATSRALIPRTERLVAPLRSPANTAYSYWRKSVLSTPKWPMRVSIDEQMRIAANIGAVSAIANFAAGFEKMRQAQAVHKLDDWDELKKTKVLRESMIEYARKNEIKYAGSDVISLYNAVGKKGFDEAIKETTRRIVIDGRARHKLRRNYLAKMALFGTFMGNPLMGVGYGLVSKYSRRRRINNAAQQTAALHYAGALKIEGRRLMQESTSAADIAAARSLMSDADFLKKQIEIEETAALKRANNAFEAAEELLEKAGFSGITIGRTQIRNAFGDDGRFIEEIEASNSANEALSSIYRSAHDTTQRELEKFSSDYAVRDFLDRPSDETWQQGYQTMMNRLTSADAGQEFYEIIWSTKLSVEGRIEKLTELFDRDPKLFTDLVQNSLDLSASRLLTSEDHLILAQQIIQEVDQILPPAPYFRDARDLAAAGNIEWTITQGKFNSIFRDELIFREAEVMEAVARGADRLEIMMTADEYYERIRYRLEKQRGMSPEQIDKWIEKKVVNFIRETHPGFGKTFTPKTINSGAEKGLKAWVDDKFENIFSVLAEIPSDQLARHPFFKSVYEREIRRMINPLVDENQTISLSQKKINEIESFAREQALTEVRNVLYDLRETTRAAEVLANVSPFLNAWQEVIGRWSGIAVDNPTFVANVGRLYSKEWEASALGLSEVEDENGNKYVTFRLSGTAYDEEGNERTIFDVMPESVKNKLIPKALRDTDNTVRFSKDSLNTMLEGSPGFGPMVTIPVRETVVANPQLEDTLSFMFPFGHPQGGIFDRTLKANLPSWAKAVDDVLRETHRYESVQTRMYRDLVIQAQLSGEYIDWSDETVWRDFEEESASRADQWFFFKFGTALLSPASTTLLSPFEPLKQEYREMAKQDGKLVAEDKFLSKYGEDFFALTSALSRSNDGLPASVTIEEKRLKHKKLIETLGDSGVGAYVVGAVGSDLEMMKYSQIVQNQQLRESVQPGSKTKRRELFTGRELIETNQARLGWRAWGQIADWVRSKQDEAAAAGLSTNLNAKHLRGVSAVKQAAVAKLSKGNPAWAKEYNDTSSSAEKRNSINDAFIKVLSDPVVSQRDSARHIAEYYRVRMWFQGQLLARKAAGGSAQLENTRSNADLLAMWEEVRTQMSLIPQFAPVFDRYFTRDMISEATFIEPDKWPEGFLINV